MTKVTEPLEDFADAGEDNRDAAGYGPRVLAKEAGLEDYERASEEEPETQEKDQEGQGHLMWRRS